MKQQFSKIAPYEVSSIVEVNARVCTYMKLTHYFTEFNDRKTRTTEEEKTTKNIVQNKSGSNQHAAGVCS